MLTGMPPRIYWFTASTSPRPAASTKSSTTHCSAVAPCTLVWRLLMEASASASSRVEDASRRSGCNCGGWMSGQLSQEIYAWDDGNTMIPVAGVCAFSCSFSQKHGTGWSPNRCARRDHRRSRCGFRTWANGAVDQVFWVSVLCRIAVSEVRGFLFRHRRCVQRDRVCRREGLLATAYCPSSCCSRTTAATKEPKAHRSHRHLEHGNNTVCPFRYGALFRATDAVV